WSGGGVQPCALPICRFTKYSWSSAIFSSSSATSISGLFPGVRGDWEAPADRRRARAREDRARRRVLREAAPLPERRFLLGHHLRTDERLITMRASYW